MKDFFTFAHKPGPAMVSLPQAIRVSSSMLKGSTLVNLVRKTLKTLPQFELYSPTNVRERASMNRSAILAIFL